MKILLCYFFLSFFLFLCSLHVFFCFITIYLKMILQRERERIKEFNGPSSYFKIYVCVYYSMIVFYASFLSFSSFLFREKIRELCVKKQMVVTKNDPFGIFFYILLFLKGNWRSKNVFHLFLCCEEFEGNCYFSAKIIDK